MLKAAIIGLGVGEAHIAGYLKHPQCRVVAACDFSKDVLKEISPKYPDIQFVSDADEILENPEIDIVSIASYDNYHYEQIIKALDNNKHIFVEKPVCLYKKEAIDIRKKLKEQPYLRMSSNLILRSSERFKHLNEMIRKNELGEIYYMTGAYNYGRLHKITEGWRGKLDFYSIVYGGGIHIIDLFLWMMPARVKSVYATGNRIATRHSSFSNYDMVSASLHFDNFAIAQLSCNFACVHPHFHQLEVYGTKGTFINRRDCAELYKTRENNQPEIINTVYPGMRKGDLIPDFIESIVSSKKPIVCEQDIFDAMSVCFAVEESCHSGKVVDVEYI